MKKIVLFLALVGCKQGLGERCQVDDDCSSPYTCNHAKMECQGTSTGDEDASLVDAPTIVIDAPAADATPADAAVDAAVLDAAIDASI